MPVSYLPYKILFVRLNIASTEYRHKIQQLRGYDEQFRNIQHRLQIMFNSCTMQTDPASLPFSWHPSKT